MKFTVVGEGVGQIRFGLGAIRGVGSGAVRSIIEARAADGPFDSLFDLLSRIDLRLCNKRVAETLIASGALDPEGPEARPSLIAGLDTTYAAAQTLHRDRESSQSNFLGDLLGGPEGGATVSAPELPEVAPWSETERLAREKETLGFFISGHPLDRFREEIGLFDAVNTSNLHDHRDRKVELACVVTEVARQISKKDGSEWGRITVEDFYGTATVLAFRDTWAKVREVLVQDAPVLIKGGVSGRERDEDDPPIFVDEAVPLERIRTQGDVGICITLGSNGTDPAALQRAAERVRKHRGDGPLLVEWTNGGSSRATRLRSKSIRVTARDALVGELREILGESRVRLVRMGSEST